MFEVKMELYVSKRKKNVLVNFNYLKNENQIYKYLR